METTGEKRYCHNCTIALSGLDYLKRLDNVCTACPIGKRDEEIKWASFFKRLSL